MVTLTCPGCGKMREVKINRKIVRLCKKCASREYWHGFKTNTPKEKQPIQVKKEGIKKLAKVLCHSCGKTTQSKSNRAIQLCEKCNTPKGIRVTCPTCGRKRLINYAFYVAQVRHDKPFRCKKCCYKEMKQNGTWSSHSVEGISMNGCFLLPTANGRCTDYGSCVKSEECLKLTSLKNWDGWKAIKGEADGTHG